MTSDLYPMMARQQRAIVRGRFWLLFVPIASMLLFEAALVLLGLRILADRVALPILPTPTLVVYLGSLSLLVSLALTAFWVARERWTIQRCAHYLDRRYALSDRLASACALGERGGRWEEALVRDAAQRLSVILPGSANRPVQSRWLVGALTLFMLGGTPIFLWPLAEAGARPGRSDVRRGQRMAHAPGDDRRAGRAAVRKRRAAKAAPPETRPLAQSPTQPKTKLPDRRRDGGKSGPQRRPQDRRADKPPAGKKPKAAEKPLLGQPRRVQTRRRKIQVQPLVGSGRFRIEKGSFFHADRTGSEAGGKRRWTAQLHQHYQRLGEHQIEREVIPKEDQRLVRRYLELIRPRR